VSASIRVAKPEVTGSRRCHHILLEARPLPCAATSSATFSAARPRSACRPAPSQRALLRPRNPLKSGVSTSGFVISGKFSAPWPHQVRPRSKCSPAGHSLASPRLYHARDTSNRFLPVKRLLSDRRARRRHSGLCYRLAALPSQIIFRGIALARNPRTFGFLILGFRQHAAKRRGVF